MGADSTTIVFVQARHTACGSSVSARQPRIGAIAGRLDAGHVATGREGWCGSSGEPRCESAAVVVMGRETLDVEVLRNQAERLTLELRKDGVTIARVAVVVRWAIRYHGIR